MVVPVQAPRTLYDKIWDDHVVYVHLFFGFALAAQWLKQTFSHQQESGETLLYIDRFVAIEYSAWAWRTYPNTQRLLFPV